MANGDAAAAAGLATFTPVQDHGEGYDNDNIRGDELAEHMTNGGHPYSKITGKPTTFPPSAHTHEATDISDSTGAGRNVLRGSSYAAIRALLASSVGQDLMVASSPADARAAINAASTADIGPADEVTPTAYSRTVSGGGYYAMWMDSGHRIGRNVSSRRYKEDIQPHALDPAAVLGLQPVSYHRKGDPDGREYGLIAEDVAEAGIEELVVRDGAQAEGLRYDLLAVALLEVVKDQEARIAALEAAAATDQTPED